MALGVDSVIFIDGRVVMNTSVVVNKRSTHAKVSITKGYHDITRFLN